VNQVQAIRVVEEDRRESVLLPDGLRDEEVFLAQLHRRSRLLNEASSLLVLSSLPPSLLPFQSTVSPSSHTHFSLNYVVLQLSYKFPSCKNYIIMQHFTPSLTNLMATFMSLYQGFLLAVAAVVRHNSAGSGIFPSISSPCPSDPSHKRRCSAVDMGDSNGSFFPWRRQEYQCNFTDRVQGLVCLHPAPVKTVARMREKLAK
jgi:hypothetical protein